MAKGPFDFTPDLGNSVRLGVKSAEVGLKLGRSFSGWSLKRRLESEGYDPITIDAAVEAVKAGRDPEPLLMQARHAYALRQKQSDIRKHPPPVHGSARWAAMDDVREAGLFRNVSARSLNLGQFEDQSINWDGESHLLTIAPTRTGKSTMQIIPNLQTYGGSAVVLDPKGEIYTHTVARRANLGPVHVLNPFGVPDVPATASFNPLDDVVDSQTALQLAEILYPRTHDDKQQFFENEAVAFLTAVVEFMALYAPAEHRNLGTLRDTVSTLDNSLYSLLTVTSDEIMPPSIRNAARNFRTKSRETGQPRVLDSLNSHLRIWDSEGLRRCTMRTDFDFKDLKNTTTTIYLVLPFEKIGPYSTFVRMLFATALDAMLLNPKKPDIPVLFVLDEFLALDHDDRFISALRTHASAGVRLWFFLQTCQRWSKNTRRHGNHFFRSRQRLFSAPMTFTRRN